MKTKQVFDPLLSRKKPEGTFQLKQPTSKLGKVLKVVLSTSNILVTLEIIYTIHSCVDLAMYASKNESSDGKGNSLWKEKVFLISFLLLIVVTCARMSHLALSFIGTFTFHLEYLYVDAGILAFLLTSNIFLLFAQGFLTITAICIVLDLVLICSTHFLVRELEGQNQA